jgi:hypothetical protein
VVSTTTYGWDADGNRTGVATSGRPVVRMLSNWAIKDQEVLIRNHIPPEAIFHP